MSFSFAVKIQYSFSIPKLSRHAFLINLYICKWNNKNLYAICEFCVSGRKSLLYFYIYLELVCIPSKPFDKTFCVNKNQSAGKKRCKIWRNCFKQATNMMGCNACIVTIVFVKTLMLVKSQKLCFKKLLLLRLAISFCCLFFMSLYMLVCVWVCVGVCGYTC